MNVATAPKTREINFSGNRASPDHGDHLAPDTARVHARIQQEFYLARFIAQVPVSPPVKTHKYRYLNKHD